jgi:hypothetical protein
MPMKAIVTKMPRPKRNDNPKALRVVSLPCSLIKPMISGMLER